MKAMMNSPVIFDGRNLYDTAQMQRLGFTYHSIGRPSVLSPNSGDPPLATDSLLDSGNPQAEPWQSGTGTGN